MSRRSDNWRRAIGLAVVLSIVMLTARTCEHAPSKVEIVVKLPKDITWVELDLESDDELVSSYKGVVKNRQVSFVVELGEGEYALDGKLSGGDFSMNVRKSVQIADSSRVIVYLSGRDKKRR